MQNDSFYSADYKQGHKVAIPRLRREPPLPKTSERNKEGRAVGACNNCRKQKTKCSGEVPRCSNCQTYDTDCLYEKARRDRLKEAIQLNQTFVSLLQDLSLDVDEGSKQRIKDVLEGAEDDLIASAPIPSPKAPGKRSRKQPSTGEVQDDGHGGEASVSASVGSNEGLDHLDEDLLRNRESRETGYMGQNSEVQWLRSVQRQVDHTEAEPYGLPYGPPGTSQSAIDKRSEALHDRRKISRQESIRHITDSTFYLDSDSLDIDFVVDPYEIPEPEVAELLFNCYVETVHTSFPILPTYFEHDFRNFIESVKQNRAFQVPNEWRATLNLVFAIGAKYSHLIDVAWKGDGRDHLLYMTRAVHLLGLKNTAMIMSGPDLGLIQATGIFSFYFLVIGHVNRAWAMIGFSIRLALALGLHLRNEDPSATISRKEVLARTWWSLYSIECLLSALTGRPPSISTEECTASLPQTLPEELDESCDASRRVLRKRTHHGSGQASASSSTYESGKPTATKGHHFVDYVNIALITQKVSMSLYSPRTAAKSWEYAQSKITQLLNELEDWALTALPDDVDPDNTHREPKLQRERFLLKMHYWSTKILITRPCLCRTERRIQRESEGSANFNSKTAEACVQAAREVTRLFADKPDPHYIYSNGPWWSITHNIMQPMAVLLLEMVYQERYMQGNDTEIPACIKKLTRWLRFMQHNDPVVAKAHRVFCKILKSCAPFLQPITKELLSDDPDLNSQAQAFQYFPDPLGQQKMGQWSQADSLNKPAANPVAPNPSLQQQSTDPFFGYQPASDTYFLSDQLPMTFGNLFVNAFDQGAPAVNMQNLWPRSTPSEDPGIGLSPTYHQQVLQDLDMSYPPYYQQQPPSQ